MTDNDSTAGTDTSEQQAADVSLLRQAAVEFSVFANEAARAAHDQGDAPFANKEARAHQMLAQAELNAAKARRLNELATFIEENGIFFPSAPNRFVAAVTAAIERGKEQIRADVARGRVPGGVDSFGALQYYVDANGYGVDPFPEHLDGDELTAFINTVQDELDRWLRDGGAKMVEA